MRRSGCPGPGRMVMVPHSRSAVPLGRDDGEDRERGWVDHGVGGATRAHRAPVGKTKVDGRSRRTRTCEGISP